MCYANKEIETLNREYLQNIVAVFFFNKRKRLTASVLLPCLHSWLQFLFAKNQIYFSLRPLRLGGTEGFTQNTQGTHTALTLSSSLPGVDDPCLRESPPEDDHIGKSTVHITDSTETWHTCTTSLVH